MLGLGEGKYENMALVSYALLIQTVVHLCEMDSPEATVKIDLGPVREVVRGKICQCQTALSSGSFYAGGDSVLSNMVATSIYGF